jgi:nucleoside-diphosphate-sugar epimerase
MEPTWLVIGGLGYLGRNFVKHLLDNALADYITVADKAVLALSPMLPIHEAALQDPRVTCIQVDMSKFPERAFTRPHSYIVNFAGETRKGMGEDTHEQNTLGVVRATYPHVGGSKWIEVSTAQVYAESKAPCTEASRLDPKTREAKWRLAAEQALGGRDHVILRPARVYGGGDFKGLSTS